MTVRLPPIPRPWIAVLIACAWVVPVPARAGGAAHVSGSVFADSWSLSSKQARSATDTAGLTPDFALKVDVDVNDDLAVSAKACFSCHGLEVAHAHLDYTPRSWFNVQAGRVSVPFGEYASRADPSGHRTASAPLIYPRHELTQARPFPPASVTDSITPRKGSATREPPRNRVHPTDHGPAAARHAMRPFRPH